MHKHEHHHEHHEHGCSCHTCSSTHEHEKPVTCCDNHHSHHHACHPEDTEPDEDGKCGHNNTRCDSCQDHDDDCGCGCGHDHEHGEKISRTLIIRFCVALAALISAVLIPIFLLRIPLFIAAYLIAGYDVILAAIKSCKRGKVFNENFLMTIATIGAFAINEYPEAVAVMLFYQLGEIFQGYAVARSRNSIRMLMDIRPDSANLVKDEKTEMVDAKSVQIGDILLVKPGERVPLDGIVTEGTLTVDTSALTGESVPRVIEAGGEILSGSIVLEQSGTIRVTNVYENSAVAKILQMVEDASSKKSKSERFITKFASIYTPIVTFFAVALALIPTLLFGFDTFNTWLYRALTFLVISCPCALVISIPLTFFAGIGGASRRGILIKGANHLETLAKTDVFVFDKTGTLTTGTFSIQSICPVNHTDNELLTLTAIAQTHSNHPLSNAIHKEADSRELQIPFPDSSREIPGNGMAVKIGSTTIYAGNKRLMDTIGIAVTEQTSAESVIYIAENNTYAGKIGLIDTEKSDAVSAIRELKASGIGKTVMLSGDKTDVAEYIGKKLGLDEIHAELLPQDKANTFQKIADKHTVAYVGDGINDAPVLTLADVGIAMGGLGSDIAIESADIVLMNDSLSSLPAALYHAKFVMNLVKQNIFLIFALKVVILILGAFGHAGMWLAVIADVGVALLAIINAMRAMRTKK